MFCITKRFTFESSHRLEDKSKSTKDNFKIFGKCYNFPSHGHSFKLYVTVCSKKLTDGMVMNFSNLSEIINKEIIEKLDHHFLNEIDWLPKLTTCEGMLIPISKRINNKLPKNIKLKRVVLWETETSYAEIEF